MLFEDTVLEPGSRTLLKRLGGLLVGGGFFLVGGTALAIQIGHRKSIDLDFFTRQPFDPDEMLELLNHGVSQKAIVIEGRAAHTLNLIITGVKVDLIRYAYPLLEPLIQGDGYSMLAIPDIAAMKLAAITNRGGRKDFFDLYLLLQSYSLQDLLGFYERKFSGHDVFFVIRSLVYFDDAEAEPDPVMLQDVGWATVRESVTDAVRSVG